MRGTPSPKNEEDGPDDPFEYEEPPPKPSYNKLETLIGAALGLTPEEEGLLLSIAPSTVNNRLAELRQMLHMKHTLEVYAYAIYRGWITSDHINAMREHIRQMRVSRRGQTR